MATVLVVEDDPVQAKVLSLVARAAGHRLLTAHTLAAARRLSGEADLVFLDRVLPDGDGLSLCRALKREPSSRATPVVVLTALDAFEDELDVYRAGADLYLGKPVPAARLRRYLEALLDRLPYRELRPALLRSGGVELDPSRRSVARGAHRVNGLPERLFEVLYLIAAREGAVLSRRQLLQRVWGGRVREKEAAVAVCRLRRVLGPSLRGLIGTVPGGYRLHVGP